jgi:hypothetical protein
MANQEHLDILKSGVETWNRWRKERPEVAVDLSHADLALRDLAEANFASVNFQGANLNAAILSRAELENADLSGANLRLAHLREASLFGASLIGADLQEADLSWANLSAARLIQANLSRASLPGANLCNAEFEETDLSYCQIGWTQFDSVDLNGAQGLETVQHGGPSIMSIDTIYLSKGTIPEAFLRAAGIPEPFIVQMKSLVAAMSPIEFYSCFISYSSKDQEFAEHLYADLQNKGVRCWFASEDLKIGDKLRPAFDEAIRVHDKLMVLLSENSVGSPWVEKEVETAFEKERRQSRTVLFPIRLDEVVMETDQAWAADIRRTRHIGDFRDWKNHDSYKKAFDRLLRDLKSV